MAKFVAKFPDLTLELTLLGGEQETLEPERPMRMTDVLSVVKQWGALDRVNDERPAADKQSPYEVMAAQLALVYPRTKEWFLENLDGATLGELILHCAQVMAGAKKNGKT